jgi:hypothetical protein
MQYFAEEIMPVLHREYGHTPNPATSARFDPAVGARTNGRT